MAQTKTPAPVALSSPSALRASNQPAAQSLARDLETLAFQLNALALTVNNAATSPSTSKSISVRYVTGQALDNVSPSDHTVVYNSGALSVFLPAIPAQGQMLYLVNASSSNVTYAPSASGVNIWVGGSTYSSYAIPANSATILQFDYINNIWRVIK